MQNSIIAPTEQLPKLRFEPLPEWFTALVDTREQERLDLTPLRSELATLKFGDYTLAGMEERIAIERKSLPDLIAVCGRERERFDKCVRGLAGYQYRLLVVEADWAAIEASEWRSNLTAAHVVGSLMSWSLAGVPFCLAGDHERAGKLVARYLFQAGRKHWRESRQLISRALAAQEASA